MLVEGTEIAILDNENNIVFKNIDKLNNEDKIVMSEDLIGFDNKDYVMLNDKISFKKDNIKTKIYKLSNGMHAIDGYKILLTDMFRKEMVCVPVNKLVNFSHVETHKLLIYQVEDQNFAIDLKYWKLLSYLNNKVTIVNPTVNKIYEYEGNVYNIINKGIKAYILCKHNDDKFIVKL